MKDKNDHKIFFTEEFSISLLPSVRIRGLEDPGLEVDREAGGVIAAGQVVHGVLLDALLVEPLELLDRHHLALVADRVHGVLVRVRRLEQPALEIKKMFKLFNTNFYMKTFRNLLTKSIKRLCLLYEQS